MYLYIDTVDGRNLANQLRLAGYLMIYGVLDIPGGAEVLPSTVFHMMLLYFTLLYFCSLLHPFSVFHGPQGVISQEARNRS